MFSNNGAFRLFKIFGITVYLHWSWFVIGIYEVQSRKDQYNSLSWNIAEYLALFAIVLMHEFGHALACRSVGGRADRIMLWPLGGVAYVDPPPRPGAVLWSIAAGPLVNVALLPITIPLMWHQVGDPDLHRFLWTIGAINIVLLLFNLLPIYPLDGGQILQALLWFAIGRARSLMVAAVIGIVGAASLGMWALSSGNYWLGVLALYAGFRAWTGIVMARQMRQSETIARRVGVACPSCGNAPPVGPFWKCAKCRRSFDPFEHSAVCPTCGAAYRMTSCPSCGVQSPLGAWIGAAAPPPIPGSQPSFPLPPIPPPAL